MTETPLFKRINLMKKCPENADGKLACYISQCPTEAATQSAEVIADKSGVCYASICRFVRKLGYTGIKEFKSALRNETKNVLPDFAIPDTDIPEQIPIAKIKENIFGVAGSIIKNCSHSLDTNLLERAVELLYSADYIYVVGLGTSAVTALYAYTKLFRLKLRCSCDTDIIIMKMKAAILKQGDVLLAISSSGRTKMIIELSRIAVESGAKVISICDFAGSPLSRCSDIELVTTARDSAGYAGVDLPLIQGQATIIDLIYACIYNKARQAAIEHMETTKNAIMRDKVR